MSSYEPFTSYVFKASDRVKAACHEGGQDKSYGAGYRSKRRKQQSWSAQTERPADQDGLSQRKPKRDPHRRPRQDDVAISVRPSKSGQQQGQCCADDPERPSAANVLFRRCQRLLKPCEASRTPSQKHLRPAAAEQAVAEFHSKTESESAANEGELEHQVRLIDRQIHN